MNINTFKENELITGISILAVLRYNRRMEISKCMLIEPFLSYTKVSQLLRRVNSNVKSVEDLIIKDSITFSNFNERYKESLTLSINATLLFANIGLLSIEGNDVIFMEKGFNFNDPTLGEKAKNRIVAANNLALILSKGDASDLYLSLRIQI